MDTKDEVGAIDEKICSLKKEIDILEQAKQKIYSSCKHNYKKMENTYDPYDDFYVCQKCGHSMWR